MADTNNTFVTFVLFLFALPARPRLLLHRKGRGCVGQGGGGARSDADPFLRSLKPVILTSENRKAAFLLTQSLLQVVAFGVAMEPR